MKYVALISGGKDSCYNILECHRLGHELVCLANLYPHADDGPVVESRLAVDAGISQHLEREEQARRAARRRVGLKDAQHARAVQDVHRRGVDHVAALYQVDAELHSAARPPAVLRRSSVKPAAVHTTRGAAERDLRSARRRPWGRAANGNRVISEEI